MDYRVLIGLVAGIVLMAALWLCVRSWRAGRARRKGRRGERMVADELKRLKRKETIVLNDVMLSTGSGKTSQVDHIVVSTRGIFVIETKNLAGRIVGSEHAQYWTQHLSTQSRRLYNPLLQNRTHLQTLQRCLKDQDDSLFTSMVVFTDCWRLDVKADDIVEPRRLLSDRVIRRTLIPSERRKRRWWRPGSEVRLDEGKIVTTLDGLVEEIKRRPRIIEREELQEIAERIAACDIQGSREARSHISYARETSREVSRKIRQGNCPRCGGQLVIKKGEKGEFVGCENYPDCRFTCSIDQLH